MPKIITQDDPSVKVFYAVSSSFDSAEEAAGFLYEWQERFESLHNEPQTLVLELARRVYPSAFARGLTEDRFFEICFEILDEVATAFDVPVRNFSESMAKLFSPN